MFTPENVPPRLLALVNQVCNGTISDEETAELESLLKADPSAREFYVDFLHVNAEILWMTSSRQHSSLDPGGSEHLAPRPLPNSNRTPVLGFLGDIAGGSARFLNQHAPWSFVLLFAIFVVSAVTFTHWVTSNPSHSGREALIAQITSMKNCRWASGEEPTRQPMYLEPGQWLSLEQGVAEITFASDAKVLLEGPAQFQVKGKNEGFLKKGKLTAQADSKTSHGFTIYTPTARFVDLGTEFGVLVDEQKRSQVAVFTGRVNAEIQRPDHRWTTSLSLCEGEAAAYEGTTFKQLAFNPTDFPSFQPPKPPLPSPTEKRLCLLDVVAGGDGYRTDWHAAGIDPKTGSRDVALKTLPDNFYSNAYRGDGLYHRANWEPYLIDGVFIPDGSKSPVVLDSAGHTFALPKTSNFGYYSISARRYSAGPEKIFMPDRQGMLTMHSNVGISFDLAAIRKANSGWQPIKFLATAGNYNKNAKDKNGLLDLWVFVDGQLRFQQRNINFAGGPFPVAVSLETQDRYLTLVVTDGNLSRSADHGCFGDPCLILQQAP